MRTDFKEKKRVPIDSLLLDEKNPRFGFAKDQESCLGRMLALGDTFFALARDIAESGLTIEPIILQKMGTKYVVRDGNRRVAALKLLNRPYLCEDKSHRDRFTKYAQTAERAGNILTALDCMVGTEDEAINSYIWRVHTGENGGVGRRGWDSLQQEFYQISIGEKGNYWRAAKLILWADANDIEVPEKFAITTLGRFFGTQKNISSLGFSFDSNDNIYPAVSLLKALVVVKKLVSDVESSIVHVSRSEPPGTFSLMTASRRDEYIESVRAEAGIDAFDDEVQQAAADVESIVAVSQPSSEASSPVSTDVVGVEGGSSDQNNPEVQSPSQPVKGGTTPAVHSADRKKYVTRSLHPLEMPKTEQKARDIYKELTALEKSPIAGMMLVRAFIETTLKAYVKKYELFDEASMQNAVLKEMLRRIKNHLIQSGRLIEGTDLSHKVEALLLSSVVSVPSMQKYIHSDIFNPKSENVISSWDEFYHFLKVLWEQVARES